MYLFKRVWEILVAPSKTWDSISQNSEDKKKYLTRYFYPLIVAVAFTAFLNPFIKGYEDLEFKDILLVGLRFFIVSLASGVLGFFLTAKVLDYSFVRWFHMKSDRRRAQMLTAFASTPVLVISILTKLISDFFFMNILFFYVVVLVWEASTHFYSVEESKQGRFTTLVCVAILALPLIVEKIFLIILPGLK